jgi:hypothetical protein
LESDDAEDKEVVVEEGAEEEDGNIDDWAVLKSM